MIEAAAMAAIRRSENPKALRASSYSLSSRAAEQERIIGVEADLYLVVHQDGQRVYLQALDSADRDVCWSGSRS